MIVLGERGLAARLLVVPRCLLHGPRRVHALAGFIEDFLIEIGGIDGRPVIDAFLLEQDCQGVDLFAGRASGMPNLDMWPGPEQRNNLFPQFTVDEWVAEHLGHRDREIAHQLGKECLVMDDLGNDRGCLGEAGGAHELTDTPHHGRPGIGAEVIPPTSIDGLEQEVDLDIFDYGLLLGLRLHVPVP
ncbi:hypothetical protein DESC_880136 [Desulfosarcina cetonica]|nr:hypothetical protein DESC_880136 [Desulfosarcina cetonica]